MINSTTATPSNSEARIDALLHALTVEEKALLLGGASAWSTPSIERLGIPAIKVSDGPNGARGAGNFAGGTITSACFPAGIALASTWNPELIEQVGQALGEETLSKGAQMLLAPAVNMHRSPLNGRNFECYSEDPYLTARIAVAYIRGLQSRNVGATVKHFVGNDSEFERNSISSEINERALREIYLPPFQAAVQEARTWSVMAAYNKVNGIFASENATTLLTLLKHEWGFDGIVMSDWFGTKSTAASINNGLDLEMPGPAIWRTTSQVLEGIQTSEIQREAVDEAVRRILRIIMRSGAFEHPEEHPEQALDRPEHRALIRTTGAESIVLLKNEGNILPLHKDTLKSLAIIGPNAKTAQIMGGGSAQVNAHYAITPYAGIAAQMGDTIQLGYEIGCTNHKLLPRLDASLLSLEGKNAFSLDYYNSLDLTGDVVYHATTNISDQIWMGKIAPGVHMDNFSVRLTGTLIPQESGLHSFGLTSVGLSRLLVDGHEVIDNWTQQTHGDTFFGMGSAEVTARVEMTAGQPYKLTVEYSSMNILMLTGFRLGYLPPIAEDAIERAVALAARSDVALLFVGLNGDWEGEGHDRPDMELVGEQVTLIERVAAANPNTVVVLQTGSPITMPWLDKVAGVLQAWYPGQECGNAIADVLFGTVNPSGKLSQTFPIRLEDNPAYINYPGENGRVYYGEGIFIGYRYYEKKQVVPFFPFGFGLSYTSFAYNNIQIRTATGVSDDVATLNVDVTNTGQHAGKEVVQVYVRDVQSTLSRPIKELKRFTKVALAAGERQTVTFTLDYAALAYWDDAQHAWVAEAGEFEVLVGSSSQDIRARAMFQIHKTVVFGGPAIEKM
ncbi:MAG: glycoside hydrolase family 3 C-terminal domain-containing protein [Ktedonobacteraceae bacterium]